MASMVKAQAMYQGLRHPGQVPSLPFQMCRFISTLMLNAPWPCYASAELPTDQKVQPRILPLKVDELLSDPLLPTFVHSEHH